MAFMGQMARKSKKDRPMIGGIQGQIRQGQLVGLLARGANCQLGGLRK